MLKRSELLEIAKPLGFKEEMYRAVIEGRKTQTRRILSEQPICAEAPGYDPIWGHGVITAPDHKHVGKFCVHARFGREDKDLPSPMQTGEIYYLTEPVQIETVAYDAHGGMADVHYLWERYDRPNVSRNILLTVEDVQKLLARKAEGAPYTPTTARFMRKVFAREFVRITDVRIQKLQDISATDIENEGALTENTEISKVLPIWINLWDSINAKREGGKYAWAANPFVFAYTFERVEVQS